MHSSCMGVPINHPSADFFDGAFHMNSYPERVAVKPMAFMISRDVRQTVRSLTSQDEAALSRGEIPFPAPESIVAELVIEQEG